MQWKDVVVAAVDPRGNPAILPSVLSMGLGTPRAGGGKNFAWTSVKYEHGHDPLLLMGIGIFLVHIRLILHVGLLNLLSPSEVSSESTSIKIR